MKMIGRLFSIVQKSIWRVGDPPLPELAVIRRMVAAIDLSHAALRQTKIGHIIGALAGCVIAMAGR
jgi:hypothetical protein